MTHNIDYSRMKERLAAEQARMRDVRATALRRLMVSIDDAGERITGPYPAIEKQGWPDKEAQARGRGDPRSSYMVSEEARLTGESVAALNARIIQKADSYRTALVKLTAVRRIRQAEIESAANDAEVNSALAGAASDLEIIIGAHT